MEKNVKGPVTELFIIKEKITETYEYWWNLRTGPICKTSRLNKHIKKQQQQANISDCGVSSFRSHLLTLCCAVERQYAPRGCWTHRMRQVHNEIAVMCKYKKDTGFWRLHEKECHVFHWYLNYMLTLKYFRYVGIKYIQLILLGFLCFLFFTF